MNAKTKAKSIKTNLYFYYLRYSWQAAEDAKFFLSSKLVEETTDLQLVSTRAAMLEFPKPPSEADYIKHRVKHLELEVTQIQSKAFARTQQVREEIQKLLCLPSEVPSTD